MTNQNQLRRLAVLNVIASRISTEIKTVKDELGKQLGRGSMTAFADPDNLSSTPIGVLSMSKPRQGKPRIVDEDAAMIWLLENFGDEQGLVVAKLSEQGRKSVLAAYEAGKDVPGIETPAPGKPVVSFRQTDEAVDEITAMVQRGEMDLDAILAIEAPVTK
ncbi:MAG: hypothetical protein WBA98_01995 [Gordonia sp. (in: high G+C Gram-positive bacteria)]|uniref:hypothetical protein n=1 Tax=Gordonia sp. (in: high G+C Gram-positive bacteria) TaxID=84139 RepID=UPI003C726FFE